MTDLDDPSTDPFAHSRARTAAGGVQGSDEVVLVFSSGTTGLPKAVRHTHASMGLATEHWCTVLGLGQDDRFQVATPPSHILGLLNLLAAVSSGATVRLHRRFDLDEVLRSDRQRADDPGDGGGADRAGPGQPPPPGGSRPLLAALHHVGGHAGDRERGRDRDRAHRRALAPGLRGQRAAGDRRQPGRSPRGVAVGLRRTAAGRASSSGSPTSTAGRSCRRGGSGRSRS